MLEIGFLATRAGRGPAMNKDLFDFLDPFWIYLSIFGPRAKKNAPCKLHYLYYYHTHAKSDFPFIMLRLPPIDSDTV